MNYDLSNRLFFRLYQTANILNKVGTRALESQQVTTQQWSILGALSRETVKDGLTVSELCDYLMVSRQNLTGILSRLEDRKLIARTIDPKDHRSRRINLTKTGNTLWKAITPLIENFYEEALVDLSYDDRISTVHYLNRLLEAMRKIDLESD
jgi:MarR family transcriptional regulator, organic hydroperoxide resistance regulator